MIFKVVQYRYIGGLRVGKVKSEPKRFNDEKHLSNWIGMMQKKGWDVTGIHPITEEQFNQRTRP